MHYLKQLQQAWTEGGWRKGKVGKGRRGHETKQPAIMLPTVDMMHVTTVTNCDMMCVTMVTTCWYDACHYGNHVLIWCTSLWLPTWCDAWHSPSLGVENACALLPLSYSSKRSEGSVIPYTELETMAFDVGIFEHSEVGSESESVTRVWMVHWHSLDPYSTLTILYYVCGVRQCRPCSSSMIWAHCSTSVMSFWGHRLLWTHSGLWMLWRVWYLWRTPPSRWVASPAGPTYTSSSTEGAVFEWLNKVSGNLAVCMCSKACYLYLCMQGRVMLWRWIRNLPT